MDSANLFCNATRRATAAASAGPTYTPLVEPHVDVVDVRHDLPERRNDVQIRPEARGKLLVAEVDADRIPAQQDDRVVRIGHVHL